MNWFDKLMYRVFWRFLNRMLIKSPGARMGMILHLVAYEKQVSGDLFTVYERHQDGKTFVVVMLGDVKFEREVYDPK